MSDDRLEGRARAQFEVAVEGGGRQIFAPALNLSASGVLLACDEPPALGTSVRVVISLPPTGVFLRLQGTVVRIDEEGGAFAVSFRAVDEGCAEKLRSFVASTFG